MYGGQQQFNQIETNRGNQDMVNGLVLLAGLAAGGTGAVLAAKGVTAMHKAGRNKDLDIADNVASKKEAGSGDAPTTSHDNASQDTGTINQQMDAANEQVKNQHIGAGSGPSTPTNNLLTAGRMLETPKDVIADAKATQKNKNNAGYLDRTINKINAGEFDAYDTNNPGAKKFFDVIQNDGVISALDPSVLINMRETMRQSIRGQTNQPAVNQVNDFIGRVDSQLDNLGYRKINYNRGELSNNADVAFTKQVNNKKKYLDGRVYQTLSPGWSDPSGNVIMNPSVVNYEYKK